MKVERLGREKKKISVYTKEELDAKMNKTVPAKKTEKKATTKATTAKKANTKKEVATA